MSTSRRSFLAALGAVVAGAPVAGWAWLEGVARPPAPRIELSPERPLERGNRAWLAVDSLHDLEPRQRCLLTVPVPHQIDNAAIVGIKVAQGADVIINSLSIREKRQLLMPVPSQSLCDLHSPLVMLPFVRGGDLLQLEVMHIEERPRPIAATWDLLVH